VSPKKKKRPSTERKCTKKSGLSQVIGQIKSTVSEKCHAWHICLDGMTSAESYTSIRAHTTGKTGVCPCCGKRSRTVHSHRLRKIQCAEFLDSRTILVLDIRHFVCTNPSCSRKIFVEPLSMTHLYGRHTHEVEKRIRHEALGQTARRASETLDMQHIKVSPSAVIRTLRRMGRANPEVRTSGFVGLDDFAKRKGQEYMCAVVDHYTRVPVAVFDSRYGSEITDWLRAHPEIKVVTRDGSQSYREIISAASGRIIQVSDRFHLMKNLKEASVDPIRTLLGQRKQRRHYPYPTEEEAHGFIFEEILQMGDARRRRRIKDYYDSRRLKDEGMSTAQIASALGFSTRRAAKVFNTDIWFLLSRDQKKAMKVAREMARTISMGHITPESVIKNMEGKVEPRIVRRCMRTLYEHYRPLFDEVRKQNHALGDKRKTTPVKGSSIWKYIVTGKTCSKRLEELGQTHPEIDQLMKICMGFRKMLHHEDDAPSMDDWLKEAGNCKLKEMRAFAKHVKKDRKAIEQACTTNFSNALLEGTVNKAKSIKREMYNRAKAHVFRAKLLYANTKCTYNYHPN